MKKMVCRLYLYLIAKLGYLAALLSWRGLRKFIIQNVSMIPRGSSILNVGAGGRVQKVLDPACKARELEVVTLDIDSARGPDIVADIVDFSSEEKFDVIIMMEVLEHVKEPIAAAANLHSLLKPGGKLLLSTPFLFPLHDLPHDYFRFTKYGLNLIFSHFESVYVEERDSWAEVICVFLARLLREPSIGAKIFSPFALLIALVLYPIAMVLSAVVKTKSFTTGYTVVATR